MYLFIHLGKLGTDISLQTANGVTYGGALWQVRR